MKKIFLFLFTTLIVLSSCSKTAEEERVSPFKLLKKIEWYNNNQFQASDVFLYDENDKITGYHISFPNNASISSENIYEGTKLVRTNEYVNGSSSVSKYFLYEYNGDFISKTSVFENNNLISEEVFTYTNNQLASSEKTEYNNLNNTEITAFNFTFNAANNTVKRTERTTISNYTITKYDTKNHPFSDTSYILAVIKSEGNKNYNNPTEITHYINNTQTKTLTIINEYDADKFLIKSTRTDTSNADIFEVIYTYNK